MKKIEITLINIMYFKKLLNIISSFEIKNFSRNRKIKILKKNNVLGAVENGTIIKINKEANADNKKGADLIISFFLKSIFDLNKINIKRADKNKFAPLSSTPSLNGADKI